MARKRPMQIEDLFRLKAVGKVAMSPDGKRVAFELKRHDAAANANYTQLMLAQVDGSGVRELTRGKHNSLRPRWSPDGASLAFLSDRDKGMTLWVLPMVGGEPRRLTAPDGYVHDFAWAPNGKRLAFAYQPMTDREKMARDGKTDEIKKLPAFKHITRLHHKLDGAGWWNGLYTHIHVIAAEGGRGKQLTSGEFDDSEPTWSPDGKLISFVSNRVPNADLYVENADVYVVAPSGGRAKKITQLPGTSRSHSWSPDGKTIAFVGNASRMGEGYKHMDRLWLVASGGGRPRELTRELDYPIFNVTLGDVAGASWDNVPAIWSPDSQRVYFLVSSNGATHLFSRSVRRKDSRCEVGGEVNISCAQRTAADGTIALTLGTAINPADVFVFDPARRGKLWQITKVNEAVLETIDVIEPEPFSVKSGAVTLQGWVMKPPGFRRGRRYPAILEIHGGPAGQYGYSMFHEMQFLAARGYVVAFSNPRGSEGRGLRFRNCIHADWGNLDYKDVMKVADWLFARPYVDRKRVGVTGGSYGGYMTNWLVTHTDRFRAAVTQRSVVNLESMYGTSDFGYDLGYEFGGKPWAGVERLRKMSPLTFVKRCRTPLLIEHEEQDHRCPIEQGEQFFTALKILGCTVEMVRFEGESHGLSRGGRPQNRAERLRRIAGWFERYMR